MYKQELFQCRELHKFRNILDNNYTDKAKIIHNQRQCDSQRFKVHVQVFNIGQCHIHVYVQCTCTWFHK